MRTLTLDIVDYPGEWLLDLPLLDKSYEQWSAETLAHLREADAPAAAEAVPRTARDDRSARAGRRERGDRGGAAVHGLSAACRDEHRTLSLCRPGRFLMPGDLAGSPALTFAPLDVPADGEPPAGSTWAMMRRRYDAYRDAVVRPFFRDHFARLDRQIVLVDALAALNAGPEAVRDLQDALAAVLDCFRVGRGGWLERAVSPARRPDPVRRDQGRPAAPFRARPAGGDPQATDRSARSRAPAIAGAEVDVIALAAVRATREARCAARAATCRRSSAPPAAGRMERRPAFRRHDRDRRCFPGDLPADPKVSASGGDFRLRSAFRPPRAGGDRRRHAGAASHSPRPRAAIPDRGPAAMNETSAQARGVQRRRSAARRGATGRGARAGRSRGRHGSRRRADPGRAGAAAARRSAGARCSGRRCRGLVLLALGLAVTSLVEDLFARAPWLGAIGAGAGAARRARAAGGDRCARSSAWCGSPRSRRCASAPLAIIASDDREQAARWSPICCR